MSINLTLIIPVYNVEKFLGQCLDSVVSQTVPFDEIILINDGSTDHSLSICQKYVMQYENFKLIDQKNKGLSAARNIGMNLASGDYIMFLDSDDYLRVDTVKSLKDKLNTYRYDAVYFNADIKCEDSCTVEKNIYDRNFSSSNQGLMQGIDFLRDCYPENYLVSACMAVYRKGLINDINLTFPEGLYYEDNYFTFMFITHAKDVTYLPEKLYQRRYRDNSITMSGYTEKKFTDYIKIVLLIWKEIICQKDDAILEYGELLLRFSNDYCNLILNNYQLCIDQKIVLGVKAKDLFSEMVEQYKLLISCFIKNNQISNPAVSRKILGTFQRIILYRPEPGVNVKYMIEEVKEIQKNRYKEILQKLPLNIEEYKIGIYGTGRHTEGLILAFESLVGEITCNLIFLDSYQDEGIYKGRKLINYQRVDRELDGIIVSSFIYEQDMLERIKSVGKEIPVYTFYNNIKEDIFSGWELN